MNMNKFFRVLLATLLFLSVAVFSGPLSSASAMNSRDKRHKPVKIEMFAPEDGHRVGIGGFGWFVDLRSNMTLRSLRPALRGFN